MRVRLGDVCDILNGFAFKSENYVDSGIRVVRITNVQKGFFEDSSPQFYSLKKENEIINFILHEDDLLISLTGNVGRVALLEKQFLPAALNQRVACLRIKDEIKIYKKYLFNYLNCDTFENECIYNSNGIAQKNLSTEWLKKYELILPPIEKQKKIAAALDKASELIALRKTQIEKMDLLIKAKFIEMFGDPVTNQMGWEKRTLNEVTTKIGSGATPRGGKESYKVSGISLIRSMNVHNGIFKYKDLAYIEENQARQLNNVIVKTNDVLINITGASVARSCIVPTDILPARVNQHVSIIRCFEMQLNPIYLNNILTNENYQVLLLSIGGAGGATREAITKEELEQLILPIPPIEIQSQFADYVEQAAKQKELMKQSLEKLEMNYKALMQDYFN